MSNTPIKRKSHAIGEQCSISQRLVEQLTAKQAILLSPEVIESELIDTKNLPQYLLDAAEEYGLTYKIPELQKMKFTLPKTGDAVDHFINMLRRYGHVHGNWQSLRI